MGRKDPHPTDPRRKDAPKEPPQKADANRVVYADANRVVYADDRLQPDKGHPHKYAPNPGALPPRPKPDKK